LRGAFSFESLVSKGGFLTGVSNANLSRDAATALEGVLKRLSVGVSTEAIGCTRKGYKSVEKESLDTRSVVVVDKEEWGDAR